MINGRPVFYAVEGKNNGCNFYRIRQPFMRLIEKDYFPCALSSMLNENERVLWTDKADVLVTQIGTEEKFLDYILENKGKKKFVLDYDDNIFSVSPFNPSYRWHGTRSVNVTLDNGEVVKLWENGEKGFDINENQNRLFVFDQVLKNVDLVTTPSPILSGMFKKRGAKNVKVIKNFIDFSVWYPVNIVKDEFVRIGYQGGWSHYEDWYLIKNPIKEILAEFPKVKLVLMGQNYDGLLKDISKERIQVERWEDVMVYPWKFKTLGVDIGVAPLDNSEFTACKSEIKWEEYSSLGIPTIASNLPPYSLSIDHNRTGLLASNESEWYEYLKLLVTSEHDRKSLGEVAKRAVKEDYNLDEKIVEYKNVYGSLFGKELIMRVV